MITKKSIIRSLKATALSSVILININNVNAANAEDRYFYVGSELGISEPVVKSFIHKSNKGETKMRLKQSRMFGGRIGYSFYPNMSVEISGTHQPRYRLGYKLPAIDLTQTIQGAITAQLISNGLTPALAQAQAAALVPQAGIPSITDITKVSSNVFTANLLYEFEKRKFGLKPYVIFGLGLAQVNIRPKNTEWQPDAALAAIPGLGLNNGAIEFFKVRKKLNNCLAYQLGGGISKDISPNFAVDLGAKLQVVKDIKIEYSTLDMTKQEYVKQKPIKKTIGVGEFTLGFTFKMPTR